MTITLSPSVEIALDARAAAQRFVESGIQQHNPHVLNTQEHAVWHNAYCRYVLLFSAPEGVEGGA